MTPNTRRGLFLAAGILLGWLGSLLLLLPTTRGDVPFVLLVLAVLVRTFLQTGLFIVAHDAMHGTLWPERAAANRRIGQAALLLYAALPYGRCQANHHRHHRHAGTPLDPDHHGEGRGSLQQWYPSFMAAYLSPSQITTLVLIWLTLGTLAASRSASPVANVVLYCTVPTLLSSLQLFLVGTFIPHRETDPAPPSGGAHQPRTLPLPTWLSFLSCYHFGYHWEHHAFPDLAWHELPEARRRIKDAFKSGTPFALP